MWLPHVWLIIVVVTRRYEMMIHQLMQDENAFDVDIEEHALVDPQLSPTNASCRV
jgi:hypothetical protein